MRICASPGKPEMDEQCLRADMVEIRMDIFDQIPEVDKEMIITLAGRDIPIPTDIRGYVDVGPKGQYDGRTITSCHLDTTPSADGICCIFEQMDGDVVKGAFRVDGFCDLMNIHRASEIKKPHVILGTGMNGRITRIRQNLLNNEFTFAHTGTPTAEGQMSVDNMIDLGDDCIITGLVGSGVTSASEKMHDTAFRHLEIRGKYLTFDVTDIQSMDDVMRSYDIRGLNITAPFKTDVVHLLDALDPVSEATGSVNTVSNHNGDLIGYNTDVVGIARAFELSRVDMKDKRTLMIGAGGASRSCAYYLNAADAECTVTGRNTEKVKLVASMFGCSSVRIDSIDLRKYDVVIDCTPSLDSPISLDGLERRHVVFDMVHSRRTELQTVAESMGCVVVDPKDMLAAQAVGSFAIWTGVEPRFETMRDVI